MGYPTNLQVVSRKLTDNVAIGSSAFTRSGLFNFGGRMSVINQGGSVIIWSALPYGPEVEKTIELVTEKPFNITHLIIPDTEHTMAAASFKKEFPNVQVVAMEGVSIPGVTIDHRITSKDANKILADKDLQSMGEVIAENFEFVYLPDHANKELVMYHKPSRILFEADLLFNLGGPPPHEQFSKATGYSDGFNPNTGKSFLTRYMQPYSAVGGWLMRKAAGGSKSAEGLKSIASLDFSTVVPCHGNVIDKNAKQAFEKVFGK